MSRATWTFGFEDIDGVVEPEVSTEVVEEREVPSETVEAELVEVEGLDREISALATDGERLGQDIDGLEGTEEVVTQSLEDGGINESAARMVNVATEHFCERWGIVSQKVATESFATGSRYQATKVAVESLGETVSAGWEKFKSWVKAASDKRKDLWTKYVNLGSRLLKRVEKARKRLTNIDWTKRVDYEEKYLYEHYGLLMSGKIDTTGVIKYLQDFSKDASKVGKKVTDVLELLKIGGDSTKYSRTNARAQMFGTIFGIVTGNWPLVAVTTFLNATASRSNASSAIPRNAEDVKVIAMPGENYYIAYTMPNEGGKAFAFRGGVTGIKGIMKAYGLHNTPVKPTKEDCIKFLDGAEMGAKGIEAHIRDWRTSEEKIAAAAAAITEASKKLKEAKKTGDIEGAAGARNQLAVARNAMTSLGDYMTITAKAATDAVNGLIHAAEQVQFIFMRAVGNEAFPVGKSDTGKTGSQDETKLQEWVAANKVKVHPASAQEIASAEKVLDVKFPAEYKAYLSNFGVLSHGSAEFCGLGVSGSSHLNIVKAKDRLGNCPAGTVALSDVGNGDFYLYDTHQQKVVYWSHETNKAKTESGSLFAFLLKTLSNSH